LLGRVEPRAIGEQALRDQLGGIGQSRLAERVLVALEPLLAGGLPRVALDEADAPVAERGEVAGHLVGGRVVVDADRERPVGGRPVATATTGMLRRWIASSTGRDSLSGGSG
jgi:hypothetical protein